MYFPVSALMALFSNILQNPLDPRARSDTRLMDLVVSFLSMLGQEAEQGGVHRMLGICSEFVRIAKVVIERAEKDQSSRRKRKNAGSAAKSSPSMSATTKPAGDAAPLATPRPAVAHTSKPMHHDQSVSSVNEESLMDHTFPAVTGEEGRTFGTIPTMSTNGRSPSSGSSSWQNDFPPARNGDFDSYDSMNAMGVSPPPVPLTTLPFTQPLLPQDLFSLPATLDWSWAEMSGGAYPSVENGNFGDELQEP